nr:metalloregulator ArsR/SmtB family transcription factor [Maritalea mediterranea]
MVEILRSAGEFTRLRLLALLAEGELSVKDLTEILDQSQPRVSRHLRLLTESGLITRHAEGAWAFFRLSDELESAALVEHILGRLNLEDELLVADRERLAAVRRDHQARAATFFAKVAKDWDRLRTLHAPDEAVEAAIQAMLKDKFFKTFLDLGTGTGRMLELLADQYKKGVGLDASREMISVARTKFDKAGLKNVQVRLADISDLTEYRDSADFVMLHQVLHHFDDPGIALRNAQLALKQGGAIMVVDFMPHKLEFLREEQAHRRLGLSHVQMQAWARSAQLEVMQAQEIPHPGPDDGLTVCIWHLTDKEKN